MKNCYSFVYLDDEVIDALYPQVFGDIIEKNVVQSREDKIDISINSNLLNILGANVGNNENNLSSENIKLVTSTSRKAQLLINYFKNSTTLIQEIIENSIPFEESIYFVGKAVFFLSDIYNKQTGNSLFSSTFGDNILYGSLNNDSVLVLETGNTYFLNNYCSQYMDSDDYYAMNLNKGNYGVMMHMSNTKIKKNIRHLTSVIKRTKYFKFYVFGELIQSSSQFYKIIPFAIWQ